MGIILALLGVLWIVMGILLVVFTDAVKDFLKNILNIKNKRALAVPALAAGIFFLAASPSISVPWFAVLLGLLSLAKGAFFLFGPQKNVDTFLHWWLHSSAAIHRTWGVVAFLMGVLLLLAI